MRMLLQILCWALLTVLSASPALALSPGLEGDKLLDDASRYAQKELTRSKTLPEDQRSAARKAIAARIDRNLTLCEGLSAKGLTNWGDLYVNLAKTDPEAGVSCFLDNAERIFGQARDLDSKEARAWAGLAEVYHVRAEIAARAGRSEEAREEAEAGFAVFEEGTALLPDSNFLFYMWGSNLVLRAYEVDEPERRALREEGIARFSRAVEIESDDQYSLRMAGTANLRMAEALPPWDDERNDLLRSAEDWYKKAFAHDPDGTCEHLSETQALLHEEDELRNTLEQCSRRGSLPDLNKGHFDFVRDKDWFGTLAVEGR